MKTGMMSYL